jgi:hypothetical protein
MFKDGKSERAHKTLRPLWRGQVIQIAVGVVLMLQFAPYWVAHRHNLHLMACGLMMHAYGLMCVLTAARNLHLQNCLDYAAPVIEIQRRLAALRTWRLREALLHGATGCFIWIPLVLIGFEHVGADIWVTARSVVWADFASAAACLVLMYGIVRWSRLPGHERFRATLDNTIIGRSVRNTQAMLDEIARFERA